MLFVEKPWHKRLWATYPMITPRVVHRKCGQLFTIVIRGLLLSLLLPPFSTVKASDHAPKIAVINLIKEPIFDERKPEENKPIHQLANRLHRMTADSVILRQLPMRVGDPYQPSMMAEAERILRANPYIANASIEVSPMIDGSSDVAVTIVVQDAWTIIPGASYANIDGDNRLSLSITDLNFLGQGQTLRLGYTQEEDQSAISSALFAPFWLGSATDLTLSASTGNAFNAQRMSIIKPFRDFNAATTYGIEAYSANIEQNRYLRTEAFYGYDLDIQDATIFWGKSFWGTSSSAQNRHAKNRPIQRWRVGLHYEERLFKNQVNRLPSGGPIANRQRVSPWISVHRFNDNFIKTRNIRTLQRVEDLFLGRSWRFRLGFADNLDNHEFSGDQSENKSNRNYWAINASVRDTLFYSQPQFLQTQLTLTTQWSTHNERENWLATASANYYYQPSEKHQTRIQVQRTQGRSLTIDRLLTQGGNQGLRGYPEFYQLGNERYLIKLEQLYFHDWNLWQLFQVATSVYLDAGRAWFSEPSFGFTDYTDDALLWNLGIGWRLGSNRIGSGSLLHIDIAFPMTDAPNLSPNQLLPNQLGEAPESWRFTVELKSRL